MIIVANFGMVSNGECHKIQHIHLFLEKLWKRFGNLKIFCCCLVLNRKTSNVNMEPKNGKILDDIGWLLLPNCTLLFLDTPFLWETMENSMENWPGNTSNTGESNPIKKLNNWTAIEMIIPKWCRWWLMMWAGLFSLFQRQP